MIRLVLFGITGNGAEESAITTQGDLLYYGGSGPIKITQFVMKDKY